MTPHHNNSLQSSDMYITNTVFWTSILSKIIKTNYIIQDEPTSRTSNKWQRSGFSGSFFLWLLFFRSQVIIKKFSNDNFSFKMRIDKNITSYMNKILFPGTFLCKKIWDFTGIFWENSQFVNKEILSMNFKNNDANIKVIYTKYSKHWLYTVAHIIDCVCSKINNSWFNPWFSFYFSSLCPAPYIEWYMC